jgi:DNA-binding HxlR family transcriptional regulator
MSVDQSRSDCPVACTLDLIGDRWTLLVVRDLFLKKTRFDEFLSGPEGIATNILADRLRKLEQMQLVERIASPTHRARASYRLTAKGQSLAPVVCAIRDWGLTYVPGTRAMTKALSAAAPEARRAPSPDKTRSKVKTTKKEPSRKSRSGHTR